MIAQANTRHRLSGNSSRILDDITPIGPCTFGGERIPALPPRLPGGDAFAPRYTHEESYVTRVDAQNAVLTPLPPFESDNYRSQLGQNVVLVRKDLPQCQIERDD